jgi:hypothetical protein
MSTDAKDKVDDLNVVEETDGSVTVDLPDHLADHSDEGADSPQYDAGDVDHPDDTDAVREARRNRRRAKKEYIKRTNEEKDQRLGLLQRQNQELMERLSVVERKTHGADLARYEKAMEDEAYRLQYAQQKMREATDNSDGAAFTKAQELWYDSRRKLEAMNNYKEQAARAGSQESAPANPKLVRLANSWMDKNSWYDPEAGDEDTQIAKVIDNRLVSEGWDPATQDYWDELDNRLQKRLPHRYTRNSDEPSRRSPRSVVTGSSRESSGRVNGNQFVLEPEQVRAMKDAGFWDDPEKRNKMIKRYAIEARNKRS